MARAQTLIISFIYVMFRAESTENTNTSSDANVLSWCLSITFLVRWRCINIDRRGERNFLRYYFFKNCSLEVHSQDPRRPRGDRCANCENVVGKAFKRARGHLKMSGIRATAEPLTLSPTGGFSRARGTEYIVLTVTAVRFLVAIVSPNRTEPPLFPLQAQISVPSFKK